VRFIALQLVDTEQLGVAIECGCIDHACWWLLCNYVLYYKLECIDCIFVCIMSVTAYVVFWWFCF